MKQTGIKTLYRLFAYLSDCTNGFRPFAHYKLMLGALLISLTANACKGKPTPTVPVADPDEWDNVMCYEPAAPDTVQTDTLLPPPMLGDGVVKTFNTSCDDPIPDDTIVPLLQPKELIPVIEEPIICYMSIINEPAFPGGEIMLEKYLSDNIIYPEKAKELEIEGTVYVKFLIEKTGYVSNIQIIKSPHELLSNEVIRVFKSMPRWIPGKEGGRAVAVEFGIPVIFKLEQ